jgi:hypothetical protein
MALHLDQPTSLLDFSLFEHARIVIFWFIDSLRDDFGGHSFSRKRSQDFFSRLSGKPCIMGFRWQNDSNRLVKHRLTVLMVDPAIAGAIFR